VRIVLVNEYLVRALYDKGFLITLAGIIIATLSGLLAEPDATRSRFRLTATRIVIVLGSLIAGGSAWKGTADSLEAQAKAAATEATAKDTLLKTQETLAVVLTNLQTTRDNLAVTKDADSDAKSANMNTRRLTGTMASTSVEVKRGTVLTSSLATKAQQLQDATTQEEQGITRLLSRTHVTVSAPGTLNPDQPFASIFRFENDSDVDLSEVDIDCTINRVADVRNNVFEDVQRLKPIVVALPAWQIDDLQPCLLVGDSGIISSADITISISYVVGKHRSKPQNFGFVTAPKSDGTLYWLQRPANPVKKLVPPSF
jgi:hypothetical protein